MERPRRLLYNPFNTLAFEDLLLRSLKKAMPFSPITARLVNLLLLYFLSFDFAKLFVKMYKVTDALIVGILSLVGKD